MISHFDTIYRLADLDSQTLSQSEDQGRDRLRVVGSGLAFPGQSLQPNQAAALYLSWLRRGFKVPNSHKQLDWVSGEFIRGAKGHICLKTGDVEIPIENGMAIEAAVKPEVTYTGITGIRNDALYFMGRSPMFALPIDLLLGNAGRVGRNKTNQ